MKTQLYNVRLEEEDAVYPVLYQNKVLLITKITPNVLFLITILGPKSAFTSGSLSKRVAAMVYAFKP